MSESKNFIVVVMDNATQEEIHLTADTLSEAGQLVLQHTNLTTQSFIFDVERKLEYRILQAQPYEGEPWKKE